MLVVVVVLVVPELLSGRRTAAPETVPTESGKGPTRTYTIELGNGSTPVAVDSAESRPVTPTVSPLASETPGRSKPTPAPRPDADATAAQPGSPATVAAPASTPPAVQRPEPDPPVRAATTPQRATQVADSAPSTGTWSVQVGAFGSSESARKLVKSLEADGFAAYVSTVKREGKTLHRVRVGPESARSAADALAGRLKARGLPVSLVAND